ncbi:unnamed protein product, partial [Cylicocyclus nassatus]
WSSAALYTGDVQIWNFESQELVKSLKVCDSPVRAVKFFPSKTWIVTGSDDMHVKIYDYTTSLLIHQFRAHSDYLRW